MPMVDLGSVPGGSQQLRGYLATPNGSGPWPGVVVVHEAWGLDEVMQRQADRLASMGYLALAPDLYSDGGVLRCVVRVMRALAAQDGPAVADLDFTRDWLLSREDTTEKVGVIGFCMGGGFALVSATRGYDVVCDNYGQLPKGKSFAGAAPIVASYGGRDLTLKGMADKLDGTLTADGVPHDVKEYPNAGHSFLNDRQNAPLAFRPMVKVVMHGGPEPESAKDARVRIETYFNQYLR
jgi:carboxymethylenebutenolidase